MFVETARHESIRLEMIEEEMQGRRIAATNEASQCATPQEGRANVAPEIRDRESPALQPFPRRRERPESIADGRSCGPSADSTAVNESSCDPNGNARMRCTAAASFKNRSSMSLSLLAKIGGRRGDPDYADLTRDHAPSRWEKTPPAEHGIGIIRLSA
jgi:hypothetical protein